MKMERDNFVKFTFAIDHKTMFCEVLLGGALGTNAQKLIKHQLILKKIILLG